jgi:hypothetical protein
MAQGITLAELIVRLTAEGKADVLSALGQIEVTTQKVDRRFEGLSNTISAVGIAIGAFIGKSLIEFKNTSEEIYRFTKITGLAAEASQELGYAAKQEEVELGALTIGLKSFSKVLYDAKSGQSDASKVFKAWNIDIFDGQHNLRGMVDVMLQVADRMMNMTTDTERLALATQLFGKAGYALIPLFMQGSAGIRELMQRYKDLGVELDTKTIESGKALADQLRDVQYAIRSLGFEMIKNLMPYIRSLSEDIIKMVQAVKSLPEPIQNVIIKVAAIAAGIGVVNTLLRFLLPSLGSAGLLGLLNMLPAPLKIILAISYPIYKAGWDLATMWNKLTGVVDETDKSVNQLTIDQKDSAKIHTSLFLLMKAGGIEAEIYQKAIKSNASMLDLYNQNLAKCNQLYQEHIKTTETPPSIGMEDFTEQVSNAIKGLTDEKNLIPIVAKKLGYELTPALLTNTYALKQIAAYLQIEKEKRQDGIDKIVEEIKTRQNLDEMIEKSLAKHKIQTSIQTPLERTPGQMLDYINKLKTTEDKTKLAAKATAYFADKMYMLEDSYKWSDEQIKDFLDYMDKTTVAMQDVWKSIGIGFKNSIVNVAIDSIKNITSTITDALMLLVDSSSLQNARDKVADLNVQLAELRDEGKTGTEEYQKLLGQLAEYEKRASIGHNIAESFKQFFLQLVKSIAAVVVELLVLAGVIKLLEAIGVPAGAILKITSHFFDFPKEDAWARRQGRDFGYNFEQGVRSKIGSPPPAMNFNIVIHNANPDTYVEILSGMNDNQKQSLFEKVTRIGQLRFENR